MTKNKFEEIKENIKGFLEETGEKLDKTVEEAQKTVKDADHDIRKANK